MLYLPNIAVMVDWVLKTTTNYPSILWSAKSSYFSWKVHYRNKKYYGANSFSLFYRGKAAQSFPRENSELKKRRCVHRQNYQHCFSNDFVTQTILVHAWTFCFIFMCGGILQILNCERVYVWEEFWNAHLFRTELSCPGVIRYSWQHVTIQGWLTGSNDWVAAPDSKVHNSGELSISSALWAVHHVPFIHLQKV